MCLFHWRLVPARLKQEIRRTYRCGQEIDKKPSSEYLQAMRAAISSVPMAALSERQEEIRHG